MKRRQMFCLFLVVSLMLSWSSIGVAEAPTIPDPLFREILTKQSPPDLITTLSLRDLGITSIEGIQTLTNLRTLDLRGNPIADLEPLRNLVYLESLNLRETLVNDLSPISNLVNLQYLNIHSTPIENIEVIGNLTNLTTLIMRNVYIGEQVNILSSLTKLTRLNIRNTGISDLTVIGQLMAKGALQEEVDLLDNPINLSSSQDGYAPLRQYWHSIALREPVVLPEIPSQMIYINEIMTSNGSYVRDQAGDNPDWIELYNPSNEPIDLSGYYLSDDLSEQYKWQFPEGVSIPAKGYFLIYASGKDFHNARELHTNFKLSTAGEPVVLSNPQGEIVDYIPPVEIPRDISYGRYPDGSQQFFFFTRPTPNRENTNVSSYIGVVQPPSFSHSPGFYLEEFYLELKHVNPDVIIYYTLDGSEPTEKSLVYEEPILISHQSPKKQFLYPMNFLGPYDPAVVATDHIGQLLFKGYDPWEVQDIFQATVVRAVAYKDGELASNTVTQTFFVDPEIDQRYSLPVISLVTDPDNLINSWTGIYVAGAFYFNARPDRPWHNSANYNRRGEQWERPVSVEFFEPGGSLGFSQNMGMRIHGGVTRAFPQKSIKLYARAQYDSKDVINYPVFPGLLKNGDQQPLEEFYRLLLRNSGNDWVRTHFADALMQSLIAHRRLDTMAYRPAIVFLNGEYWGILNLRERYDKYYIATNYGVAPDDVVILDGRYHVLDTGLPGDEQHYARMLGFAQSVDMTKQENYEYIQTLMDVENFIDYYVAQIYFTNTDWPAGNIKFWRTRTEKYEPDAPYGQDGRWRWMMFDTDFGFGYAHGSEAYLHNSLQHALDNHGHLLRALLPNEQFRNGFLNTFADHLNTSFRPERVISVINQIERTLLPEMAEHIQRWGQPSTSVEGWQANVDTFRDFALKRPEAIRNILVEHFNLPGTYRLTIANPSLGGQVQVNSVLLDQEMPGVTNLESWEGEYFLSIPLQITAQAKPGYQFIGWEGDFESQSPVIVVNPDRDLKLTAVFQPL